MNSNQDYKLEQAVLGSFILEFGQVSHLFDTLKPKLFTKDSHIAILKGLQAIKSRKEGIDMLSVSQELKKAQIEMHEIAMICNNVSSTANTETWIAELKRQYMLKAIKEVCLKVATSNEADPMQLLTDLQKNALEIQNMLPGKQGVTIHGAVMEKLGNAAMDRIKPPAAKIGLKDFDEKFQVFAPSKFVVVGGRPGMGKSIFAQHLTWAMGMQEKHSLFFSLEMSSAELAVRTLSAQGAFANCKTDQSVILNALYAQGSAKEMELQSIASELQNSTFWIYDEPNTTIEGIFAKAQKHRNQHGQLFLVVIDFLQLINATDPKQVREQQVAHISRQCKLYAKSLNCCVVALCQLSRAVEQRGGGCVPCLSDLRESGSIEQDADCVIFPYRPWYYHITEDESGNSSENLMRILVEKNRGGKTGHADVDVDLSTAYLSDRDSGLQNNLDW